MTDNIRIAICQINCVVGDLNGNKAKILEYIRRAESINADIVCFPELAITGYPPEDLILKPYFVRENIDVMYEISKEVNEMVVVCGFVNKEEERLYNAAAVMYKGLVCGIYHKVLLPNYGVFDEKRYFSRGGEPLVFAFGKIRFGVNICEDIWFRKGPIRFQAMASATLILNISASPYHAGKIKTREALITAQAREYNVAIVYTNMVGGQDELVFDGGSIVVDRDGYVIAKANQFKEELLSVDIPLSHLTKVYDSEQKQGRHRPKKIIEITDKICTKHKPTLELPSCKPLASEEEIYNALMLGLYDYVKKNGFSKVVVGLSGGIDSSLVCAIACDAIGSENVTGVFMPSSYTSKESAEDVYELGRNLNVKIIEIPITSIFTSYIL
ncbi:MAG: nitrilase-related carbon-nitrogen hydrolase, partial [Desulfatiglandales bacterium]